MHPPGRLSVRLNFGRAARLPSILRQVAVEVSYYTDPCCPWSWGLEPAVRRLRWTYGESLDISYVMAGMAREFGEALALVEEMLEVADEAAMPIDPRLWLEAPLRSSHPACIAVTAAAEQGHAGSYLRRLREGIMCRRRKLDSAESLMEEARAIPGLDAERFRIDLGSHATLERFGTDLERAKSVPQEHHAEGADRAKLPSLEFRTADGTVHGVYGYSDYSELRTTAERAGAQALRRGRPTVEEALRHFGSMATPEVAAVCDLPGPRAPAELWRLALDWRIRPERVGSGELWALA
jgi:putative protein-disulfide isomerase